MFVLEYRNNVAKEKNMKNTKKLLTWILMVVLVVCTVGLVACVEKPTPQDLTELKLPKLKDNQVAVIIKNAEKDYTSYTVTLSEDMTSVEDVLAYLKENGMHLDWTDGPYGKTMNSIGKAVPDPSKNEFVAFFTTVESDKGNWAGVPTYVVEGVQIVSAGVGVSDAKVQSGAIFYFEISTY